MITGHTTSRLLELKKIKASNVFSNQYVSDGSVFKNGVDYNNSIENMIIVYYIDGIKYIDVLNNDVYESVYSGQTLQIFQPQGIIMDNFIDSSYIKNPNKSMIINSPKIINDVFIDRQETSVFDVNSRLEFIDNIGDLITYAAGRYFNIINNN